MSRLKATFGYRNKHPSSFGKSWAVSEKQQRRQTGPERATFTPNVPELCSVFLFMMSCMVEMGNCSLLSLLWPWSKSTAQLGLGRLRLDARFSARVLGGGSPSQIRLQAVVMPQKEGSSECEDPSELPSDGESLNIGWSNLFVKGEGLVMTGTPLHTTPPLYSSGEAWKEGFRVSTFSKGFILRRLLCEGKDWADRNSC